MSFLPWHLHKNAQICDSTSLPLPCIYYRTTCPLENASTIVRAAWIWFEISRTTFNFCLVHEKQKKSPAACLILLQCHDLIIKYHHHHHHLNSLTFLLLIIVTPSCHRFCELAHGKFNGQWLWCSCESRDFRHQRSAIRIQSSAILFTSNYIEKMIMVKKWQDMAQFKNLEFMLWVKMGSLLLWRSEFGTQAKFQSN